MCLVDDYILPRELLKWAHAHADTLKGCKADVELAWLKVVLQLLLALLFGGDQIQHADLRTPQLEFFLPVGNDSLGHNNQEVALDLLELAQKGQKSDCLDGLAKSLQKSATNSPYHFVCENSVDACLVQANQPVETVELVVPQLASFQDRWLLLQSSQSEVSVLFRLITAFADYLLLFAPCRVMVSPPYLPHRLDCRLLHLLELLFRKAMVRVLMLDLTLHDELGERVDLG